MIALLRGTLAHLTPGEVILDVQGVGYRVRVPVGARLGGIGGPITLHTHLAVREDAMDLYGFPTAPDRDLFTVLVGTSGIGPKTALAAIDTLGAEGIRGAVAAEDAVALTAIPGVGRKGAARMVLELRSKLGAFPAGADGAVPTGPTAAADARGDARQALGSLGYGAAEVEAALRGLPRELPAEELIRRALKGLA